MSFTHQRWENGPGPVVGCKLGVHRQHHAAADASSCRRQAQQHQTAFYSLSSFNITMHSPPSEVGPPKDNTIALESQTNVVMANKTSNRTSVPRLKVCSHELCTHSQANKKSEGCQIKARPHVHFKIASDEPKIRKTIAQSAVCNESPSSSSSSIGQGSNNSSCLSEKTSQESGEEKEVQSSLRSPLDHMSNLEDSLPIKRGLSRFYNGKSQSFTSLTDVSSVGDLAKPENPYVKKRKWLHEHGSSSKDRFGYPPNCHSYSGIAKNSMPSRGRANPSLFSAGGGSVDSPQVSRDFLGSSDQQKRVVCPRSYSLGDLQGSGC